MREHLVQWRRQHGNMSQETLAKNAGISTRSVARVELGGNMSDKVARGLAKATAQTEKWVRFGPDGDEPQPAEISWPEFRDAVYGILKTRGDPELEARLRFTWEAHTKRTV